MEVTCLKHMDNFNKTINDIKKTLLLWRYMGTLQPQKVTKNENTFQLLFLKVNSFKIRFISAVSTNKAVYSVLHDWNLAICYIAIWFCLSWILTIKHLLKTLLVKPFLNNCDYYLLIVIHLHNQLGPPSVILTHIK